MAPVPRPPDFRRVSPAFAVWPRGERLVRVYDRAYRANEFHAGKGDAIAAGQFYFFRNATGQIVPVLYAADQEDGAISETVFPDVPIRGAGRVVLESRLRPLAIATLRPERDLQLVELLGHGLRRLQLRAEQLTSTEAAAYPDTVAWAQSLYAGFPQVDGLVWMSRQFNSARAVILFGGRVAREDLAITGPPQPLIVSPGRRKVEEAANRAGIALIWS